MPSRRGQVRRPRSDGSAVFDAILAPAGYFALPIAHQRGLFRLLEGKRLTLGEICEALELKPRPTNALLAAATSLGLLELSDDRYALTPLAEDYLLESSPTYMGFFLDLSLVGDHSYSAFDRAVGSDSSQRPDQDFASFEQHAEQASVFTRGMHSVSVASALVWPELVDLAGNRLLLDVGGGSGAHSIGVCLRWPELRAIVLDLPPVCDVADEFVARHSLEGRITTRHADMWADPFPPADVHFYSNILHDWPGTFLIQGDSTQITNVDLLSNDVQNRVSADFLIDHDTAGSTAGLDGGGNRFFSQLLPVGSWTLIGSTPHSVPYWMSQVGDTTSTQQQIAYVDPGRSAASYNASQGGIASHAAFMVQARQQSFAYWRPQYMAVSVDRYVRSGFRHPNS